VNRALAVVLALLAAVHVSIPAMGLAAPAPVLLAFAGVIFTLVHMIGGRIRRDGLFPVWLRVTA
jgi:hypothetical protein